MNRFPPVTESWKRVPPPLQLLLFGAGLVGAGLLSVAWFRPAGSAVAVWWPVAGLGLVGVLIATKRQRPAVLAVHLVATMTVNALGGQALVAAALLGVINVLEVVCVVALLELGGRDPRRLHDPLDLGRLLVAVLAGTAFVAVAVGAVAAATSGAALIDTVRSVAPSHASALLLFGILPMRGRPGRAEAGRLETSLQWLVVAAVTGTVFAPGQRLALAFLVMPAMLWGVLRGSTRAVGSQLVTVAGLVVVLTLEGGGPFAVDVSTAVGSVAAAFAMVQVFVVTLTVVTLLTMLVVQARRGTAAAIAERDRRARLSYERGLTGMVELRPGPPGATIVELNPVAASFLGGGSEVLSGTPWCEQFVPEHRARIRAALDGLVAGRTTSWHGELASASDGEERWFEVALFPSLPDGTGPLITAQMLDVTARRATEQRLTELALRDGLTGAANRLLFDDRLSHALTQAGRSGRPVGVLFLDLDDFKPVNDLYGHQVGDRLLVVIAERLRTHARSGDTVARLGGDEFAVVLPEITGVEELDALRERLRAAVLEPIVMGALTLRVGVSIGTALGRSGDHPQELLRVADESMYRDKRVPVA